MMKLTVKLISLAIVAVFSLSILAACNIAAPGVPAASATNPAALAGYAYVSMRINPEIELVTDEYGEVVAANPINEDGEVVLCEVDMVGMSIDEAGVAFTEAATELGYVDVESEDNTVYVDVQSENPEQSEEITRKLSEKITHFFENKGIGGKVSPETLEKYADKVDAWGVSAGHAKTILRVLELYPEMTEEEVLALGMAARLALIKDYAKNDGLTVKQQKLLKQEKDALKQEYAEMVDLEQQLKELKEQMDDPALTKEQKNELSAQCKEAEERAEELRAAYREQLDTLKQAHKQNVSEQKQLAKQEAQQRKQDNAEKLAKHEQKQKDKQNKEDATTAAEQ